MEENTIVKMTRDLDLLTEKTELLRQTIDGAITDIRLLRRTTQGAMRTLIKIAVLALTALIALTGVRDTMVGG